jgi:hypothetical protein
MLLETYRRHTPGEARYPDYWVHHPDSAEKLRFLRGLLRMTAYGSPKK